MLWLLLTAAAGVARARWPPPASLKECPGESRFPQNKCVDGTFVVCAHLLDRKGQPELWGEGDFWNTTNHTSWADKIADGGDSACICQWLLKDLIKGFACDAVHLRCEATDVTAVLEAYKKFGEHASYDCIVQKCASEIATHHIQLDADLPARFSSGSHASKYPAHIPYVELMGAVGIAISLGVLFWMLVPPRAPHRFARAASAENFVCQEDLACE
eukprot:gnl/TRDRNA2_/TRDRNA2_159976_c0_seq1.p1 gnl/TRDRNA2_/TRDRNA2_159976_c0~~gnl/TRDRNA2_/TRDRNA2_159976_c0_seq1.p1  ORF type:complete len:216 (-),score=34.13 gnl/TRDRNA2_/TRDRNA2_159976_c0_seq1:83-730(-)